MKPRLSRLLAMTLLWVADGLAAETVPPTTSEQNSSALQRTPEQLDQLLGPIALYPDALIALILPSATASSDVVLAARYLNSNGDPARIDDQSWDDSVKALAHYPDVVKWMDQNLAWTKQVGEAFVDQPADVMKSIQRLRAAARAAGTLVDTPQQQVVVENENIAIVPTQPTVIYVPTYDPEIVYVPRREFYPAPFLTFGVGYAAGGWLCNDLDWGHRRVVVIPRHEREHYWRDRPTWHHHHPDVVVRPGFSRAPVFRPWTPNPIYTRSRPYPNYHSFNVIRPAPFARGQPLSPSARWNGPDRHGPDRPVRLPGTRDQPRSAEEHRFIPHRRPENSPPAPPARQTQPSSPAPGFDRGNRFPRGDDQRTHENRGRFSPPPGGAVNAPAVGRVMSPPAQPNVIRPPQHTSLGRENRGRPASAPVAQPPPPQQQPKPATSSTEPHESHQSGRGRR